MMNRLSHDRSLTPVPPLMEQLANTLSQQAGKCLVIPKYSGSRFSDNGLSCALS